MVNINLTIFCMIVLTFITIKTSIADEEFVRDLRTKSQELCLKDKRELRLQFEKSSKEQSNFTSLLKEELDKCERRI